MPEACELIRQAALALEHANECGLVHRDVKPSNLMLTESGQVKLLDLGLARLRSEQAGDEREMTVTGQTMGTLDYMAPEQFDDSHQVDGRADVYGLGATFYKLLTGQAPFSGSRYGTPAAKIKGLLNDQARPVSELRPEVPTPVAVLVDRMLAKRPEDRLATAGEAAAQLASFSAGANLLRLVNLRHGSPETNTAVDPTLEAGHERRGLTTDPPADLLAGGRHEAATPPRAPLPPRHRRNRTRKVAIALGLGMALALATLVIYIQTDRGVIEIKTFDDDIAVTVKRNGRPVDGFQISQRAGALSYRTGHYEIELQGGAPSDVEIRNEQFTLTRNGREIVEIVRKTDPKGPAARAAHPQPAAVGKSIAQIRDGREVRLFASFAGAIEELQAGDLIELRGEGPFPIPRIRLDGTGLLIRAASGVRPRLVPIEGMRADPAGPAWIEINNAPLRIEGCDLECRTGNLDSLAGGGGPWHFHRCRILRDASHSNGLLNYRGPELTVTDSLILCEFSHWSMELGPNVKLRLAGNVIAFDSYVLATLIGGGQLIEMERNTVVGPLLLNARPDQGAAATIQARGNLFQTEVLRTVAESLECYRWLGDGNVFSGDVLAQWRYSDNLRVQRIADLDEWRKQWPAADVDSKRVPPLTMRHQRLPKLGQRTDRDLPLDQLDGARAVSSESNPVGPDQNILGPGEGYLGALAAAGMAIPSDALRPEALPSGSLVLLRDEQIVAGHRTLTDAIDAAQEGDVIEIRSDRPLSLDRTGRTGKPLTVRAAPGYSPVIQGACILADEDCWTVEGISFQGPIAGLAGKGAKNLRLTNCTVQASDPLVIAISADAAKGRAQIENCLIWAGIALDLAPTAVARINNSVLTWIAVRATAGEGQRRLELSRCHQIATYYRAIDNQLQSSDLLVSAGRSIFDTNGLLTGTGTTRWSGDHNLFRLGGELRYGSRWPKPCRLLTIGADSRTAMSIPPHRTRRSWIRVNGASTHPSTGSTTASAQTSIVSPKS